METSDWQRQTNEKILFPELLWSRPQNIRQAGKLLIIGGSPQNFSGVAETYNQATRTGVGTTRVLLPQSLQKVISSFLPEAIFAPATSSGSFASESIAELLEEASWADGVILAGNLGNNSETAIVIESFVAKYDGPLIISGDAIDLIMPSTKTMIVRPDTTLVLGFSQLQRLLTAATYKTAVTSNLDLMQIVNILHDFTGANSVNIVTESAANILIATNGKISTTKLLESEISMVSVAAFAAVWLIQNPKKSFEALTTAAIALLENNR